MVKGKSVEHMFVLILTWRAKITHFKFRWSKLHNFKTWRAK